jgi:hypothetical protein
VVKRAGALAGLLVTAAIGAAPQAHADPLHHIRSIVYWTGPPCITVTSPTYPNGHHTMNYVVCGGLSSAEYSAYGGEFVGADPQGNDVTVTLGCQLFVDGRLDYSDFAPSGDHHDVNCLRILNYDYPPPPTAAQGLG